jgi:hypothetical protein
MVLGYICKVCANKYSKLWCIIIFVSKVLVFVGVLILVLGTYATLYAANESGDTDRSEAISPLPDHFDSIPRMTLVQVDKPEVDKIVVDKPAAVEKSKGTIFLTLHIYFM